MGYLGMDSNKSSMRLNFVMTTIMCSILLFAVAVYIIVNAIKCNSISDWSGMGVFVGMLLGGLTGMGLAKAQQKKYETNDKIS